MLTQPRAARDLVFSFGFRLWGDAEPYGVEAPFSPHRIARLMVLDAGIERLVVADSYRSRLAHLRPSRSALQVFPESPTRTLVRLERWRRHDPTSLGQTRAAYRRADRRLKHIATARGLESPILVTCHPVHAALADRAFWGDVVYYGWDDWLSAPVMQPHRQAIAWGYQEMARQSTMVIGVSSRILERVGSDRGTVIPNAVVAADFDHLPPAPPWFAELPKPLAFYGGTLEDRVDVGAVLRASHELPNWTFCLVGYMPDPSRFEALRSRPNVVFHSEVPQNQILAMARDATVCLVPHRETEMSVAMSPLKLYEYLAVGTPVVAADLPPIKGVSDRVHLVQADQAYAPVITTAGAQGRPTSSELRAWRENNDWSQRYAQFMSAIQTWPRHLPLPTASSTR